MKEVNLEAILKSKLTVETMRVNNPDYTWNKTIEAMKEACEQTVDLCAENIIAETINAKCQCGINVNQVNSILNTKNQIQ